MAQPESRLRRAGSGVFQCRLSPQSVQYVVDADPKAKAGHSDDAPYHWIHSAQAQMVFGVAIVLNAILIGIEKEVELQLGSDSVTAFCLYLVQCAFVFVFVVELALNLLADGIGGFLSQPIRTPRGLQQRLRWDSIFDVFVVLVAMVDLWMITPLALIARRDGEGTNSMDAMSVFRILQLLRLVRIVRLLKISKDLTRLVAAMTRSLRKVLWVFVLLLVVIYIGALICASTLGSNENSALRAYFDSVWVSMYTHFKLMTLEAWPDICNLSMEYSSPLWFCYFVVYIVITNMALLNLVIGLIMDGVVQNAKNGDEDSDELKALEARPFTESVRQAVQRSGVGADDYCEQCRVRHEYVDQRAFEALLEDQLLRKVLGVYDIKLEVPPAQVFQVLDLHQAGRLSVEELATALLRQRGCLESQHELLLQMDLCSQNCKFTGEVSDCSEKLGDGYSFKANQIEVLLDRQMAMIERVSKQLATEEQVVAAEAPVALGGSLADAHIHASEPSLKSKYVLALLHQASSKARRTNEALAAADAALQESLSREAALQAEIGFLERTCWTQTACSASAGECCSVLLREEVAAAGESDADAFPAERDGPASAARGKAPCCAAGGGPRGAGRRSVSREAEWPALARPARSGHADP